jgi:hypothetical protein
MFLHRKMAPVKGPFYLVAVVTLFDDDFLATVVVVPASVPTMVAVHPHLSARTAILLLDDDLICACGGNEGNGDKSGNNES